LNQDSSNSRSEISNVLINGLERLTTSFLWLSGTVINENGSFKISHSQAGRASQLIIKDFTHDPSYPMWEDLQQANFPFSKLDENLIAPCKTVIEPDKITTGIPVLLMQANFITGCLLLTINGQHGSMDMGGMGQVITLFAKACRNEPFSPEELLTGNSGRMGIIPLLNDEEIQQELYQKAKADLSTGEGQPVKSQPEPVAVSWEYFAFSAKSLGDLKSSAMQSIPSGSFVSTDDVLTAFIWQSISRARLPRLGEHSSQISALSRNVDMRRILSIPLTYPGFVVTSTTNTSAMDELVKEFLGRIALQLRSALDPDKLKLRIRTAATAIAKNRKLETKGFTATSNPELDVRMSSWAKGKFYELDFGLGFGAGRAEAVRRPRFVEGAREGLVYLLPKRPDGEIMVGVCLRVEDLILLRNDEEFSSHASYIG
jgi:hypothetical protein